MLDHAREGLPGAAGDGPVVQIEHKASPSSAISQFLLATPALIAWVLPIALCAHAVADPLTLNAISDRPFAAGQVVVAFAIWSLIFGFPLVRLSKRLATSRSISIDAVAVHVIDRTWLRTRQWSAPLAGYRGIAARMRTTLSSLEHQLVLVHGTDPRKNLIVAKGIGSLHGRLDELKQLLRLPEIAGNPPSGRIEPLPTRKHAYAEHVPIGPKLEAA